MNESNRQYAKLWKLLDGMADDEFDDAFRLGGSVAIPGSPLGRYLAMRHDGQSHKIALMLASGKFPGIRSDAIFNEGRYSSDAGKVGSEQLWLRHEAEKVGVSTNGKWYCHGLAEYPGDPRAWVDGMSDVRRVARENNMTVHGYVEQKGHEVAPPPSPVVAPGLIDREVREVMECHPGSREDDVRERVFALRSGAIDPNPQRVTDLPLPEDLP